MELSIKKTQPIQYLYSVKCRGTYWWNFNEEYLTEFNPKDDCPYYRLGYDYEVAIKHNTLLHVFLNSETNTAYFLDNKGVLRMWINEVEEADYLNRYGHTYVNKRLGEKRIKNLIEILKQDIEVEDA